MTVALLAVVSALAINQAWVIYAVVRKIEKAAAEERRFLMNHALSSTPMEFATLASASRPDATVEAITEARATAPARPSTVAPLGL